MGDNHLKNIVVLKNLPSNIVEEAIVVLKGNKIKLPEYIENKRNFDNQTKPKDYILKEAEMIISNYISSVEGKKQVNSKKGSKLEQKYKRLKLVSIGLLIALILVVII